MSHLIFTDQQSFMQYRGEEPSPETATLYVKRILQSANALDDAWLLDSAFDEAGVAAACIDLIAAASGAMHALGLDPQALWDAVHRANVAAIRHRCPECDGLASIDSSRECERCNGAGVVYEARVDADGNLVTPTGWTPADLRPLVAAMLATRRAPVLEAA